MLYTSTTGSYLRSSRLGLVADDGDRCVETDCGLIKSWPATVLNGLYASCGGRPKQRRGMNTATKTLVRGNVNEKIGRMGLWLSDSTWYYIDLHSP